MRIGLGVRRMCVSMDAWVGLPSARSDSRGFGGGFTEGMMSQTAIFSRKTIVTPIPRAISRLILVGPRHPLIDSMEVGYDPKEMC